MQKKSKKAIGKPPKLTEVTTPYLKEDISANPAMGCGGKEHNAHGANTRSHGLAQERFPTLMDEYSNVLGVRMQFSRKRHDITKTTG